MAVGRIHRLLRLITLLESGQATSLQGLMRQLGVSRRTVFRDLKMLADAGIPYYHKRDQGYRIARSFYLPPVDLTVAETMGLMFLAKAAEAEQGRPLIDEAMAAVAKLTATVPQPLRDAGSELLATVSIDTGDRGRGDHESEHHAVLHEAIDQGRVCRVHYKSPVEDGPQTLDIEPYLLHFAVRAWYVFARSRQHEQVRLFKLTRMDRLEPLPRRFDKPNRFAASKKLGKAWRLIPEGRVYQIELEFSAKVGTNVSEVRWHESQQHEVLDDGRCTMKFEVDGLGEIAWWLCGYADQVKVRRPAALRNRLHAMHRDAAAVLNGMGSKKGPQ